MQKGFELGSLFREFFSIALPFAKTESKLLGTTLLDTGANNMKDIAKGRNFRKSLEKLGKQGVEFFSKVKTQMGGSQNRKRVL